MLLSTLLLVGQLLVGGASAHEVSPSIGDLSTDGNKFTLVLRLNLEAFVAGIDLDGVEDTNATDQSADYDSLRALPPEDLQKSLQTQWPNFANSFYLSVNNALVPLALQNVTISEVGDIDLPRPSTLTITAILPPDTAALTFGWEKRFGTLVLRHIGVEDGYTGYLSGGEISPEIPIKGGVVQSSVQVFGTYIPIGFAHILPKGLDHILFVLGLFFLSVHLRPLIWQVTAFTLAHTVTLALGALGWVTVPSSIVEPLIAASITYVAVENIFTSGLSRWRPFVIFGFGLLHGLGFASVLGEIGLPDDQFVPALIGFNVGVELGQITVISLAFLAVGAWFRNKPWYRKRISFPASAIIATIGAWWFVERVFL
ncbi:MAG: HupE/UreJ family protein [Rhodobacterales bacterium]|nr:HupE/UreJ family protein [Rhodobacterales bacterium]